MYQKEKDID